jgi:selenocysteine lyase/cysteine desulfurase
VNDIRDDPEYRATAALDRLRRDDYARLDATGHVYLDYTGAGLYGESQIRAHSAALADAVLGNPHSVSLASTASTARVESARRSVLEWFGADPQRYTAIFTANATTAIKLVGESFPFTEGGRLLLTVDNHNSVNGIREFAAAKGASVDYAPLTTPDLRIDLAALEARMAAAEPYRHNLFAFPAQSNFSGVKHPLELVARAHENGWHVLLDAAAFVPTNRLDLSAVDPDFVAVSFYKMFGYPTGIGCLIAKREALDVLQRPWFAGGTVNFATVGGRHHVLSPGEAGFEDGTIDYLNIPAVEIGLQHLERAGFDLIGRRVACLTRYLLDALIDLRHSNGRPMIRIYGPTTLAMRGGTITMNCYDPEGRLLDYRRVEELAGERGISLRTGCFCNPGPGETAEGLTAEEMSEAASFGREMTLPRFVELMAERHSGKSAGAIRASLGIVSNADDVERFLAFIRSLRDQTRLTLGDVSFDIESCRVIRDGS